MCTVIFFLGGGGQKGLRPSRDPKYIQCEVRVGVPQNEYKQAYKYKIVCQFETLNVNCFLDNCFLYIWLGMIVFSPHYFGI